MVILKWKFETKIAIWVSRLQFDAKIIDHTQMSTIQGHIAVAEWSKHPTSFRLFGSFVGSNLGRGPIIS